MDKKEILRKIIQRADGRIQGMAGLKNYYTSDSIGGSIVFEFRVNGKKIAQYEGEKGDAEFIAKDLAELVGEEVEIEEVIHFSYWHGSTSSCS